MTNPASSGAPPLYSIRLATLDDALTLATHRAKMFADMGRINDRDTHATLVDATYRYFQRAMPSGEYVGWVAVDDRASDTVIGGAGVQRRMIMPFPVRGERATGVAEGRQAIVMNVYTEKRWRRRGVANALMSQVLAWARAASLDSLVLHASSEGRPLYEQLGFTDTNEMVIVP